MKTAFVKKSIGLPDFGVANKHSQTKASKINNIEENIVCLGGGCRSMM